MNLGTLLGCALCLAGTANAYDAPYTVNEPAIDGADDDPQWQQAPWQPIDKLILGSAPTAADFSGRYKVLWDHKHLYLLAEIHDDVLHDGHADPLVNYWEDDTLEVFIDEDHSGGNHHFSYNAFAYHISLANHVVDISPFPNESARRAGKEVVRTFQDHVFSRWSREPVPPFRVFWELRITVFGDNYRHPADSNEATSPKPLHAGKQLGFLVSYCDSDGADREHFLSDVDIAPLEGDRNLGYRDADVFGVLRLLPKP